MPEHPRLNYLVGLSEACAHNADWIFDHNARRVGVVTGHEEHRSRLSIHLSFGKPALELRLHPLVRANRKEGAWRMRDY